MITAIWSTEKPGPAEQERALLRWVFTLAGAGCELRTDSPALMETIQNVSVPWAEEVVLTMEVAVRAGDWSPAGTPHFRAMHHVAVARFGAGNVVVMDLERRRVRAWVSEAVARSVECWRWTLLPILAGIAGNSIGILPAHSACLSRDGVGLLIAGESGAGKSTLAVALAQRGFDYIADDWTYCSERNGVLVAHGMEAPTKLLPDAARHFPELAAHAVGVSMNGELAYEVAAEGAFGVRVVRSCVPRLMVFLRRSEEAGARFRPMREEHARQYFARHLERIPIQMTRARENRETLMEELLRLPCWSFEYGGPPEAGAEELEAFFERQRTQWRRA